MSIQVFFGFSLQDEFSDVSIILTLGKNFDKFYTVLGLSSMELQDM